MSKREFMIQQVNRRWLRPGIYGTCLDGASGKELDRQGAIHGCAREPARFWRWTLPWGQLDETYRKRIFIHYQGQWKGP